MIKNYIDLEVYQMSYELAKELYTKTLSFPRYTKYEIGGQIRRAALSIPMNIAEGYGRKDNVNEFKQYLRYAMGSANEVSVLLNFCKDFEYLGEEEYQALHNGYDVIGKKLNVMITNWK